MLERLYVVPYNDRKNRNPDRVLDTCLWFTTHPLFNNWLESPISSSLWVSADPGCGKSVLSKYLVDEVLNDGFRAVCFFFFKDEFEDQNNITNALCCILRQLFVQRPALLSQPTIDKFLSGGESFIHSFQELWDILISASCSLETGEIICLLDALDECNDNGRIHLFQALGKFYRDRQRVKGSSLKFVLTGRPYIDIQREFQLLKSQHPIIHLSGENEEEVDKISHEINLVVCKKANDLGIMLRLQPDETKAMQDRIASFENRTYLWVDLVFEALEHSICTSKSSLYKAIGEMPRTVDEAYEKLLDRSSDLDKAKTLLHIVVASMRPISLSEMALALVAEQNFKTGLQLEPEPLERFCVTVRSICGLFVTIRDKKIYLLHQTAKEFLVGQQCPAPVPALRDIGSSLKWKASFHPGDSNRVLSEICVWHILMTAESSPIVANQSAEQYANIHPFMSYSSQYWAHHFKYSNKKDDDSYLSLHAKMCDPTWPGCLTWFTVFCINKSIKCPESFTSLMLASYFGLPRVVILLLGQNGVSIKAVNSDLGQSALSLAATNGHESVVRLLLTKSSKGSIFKRFFSKEDFIDMADIRKFTPLHHAAAAGHAGIVKLLLATGKVDVNAKALNLDTPLSLAIRASHEDIVQLLLADPRTDLTLTNADGETPLLNAILGNHDGIVKILVAKSDISIDEKDLSGRTPLIAALRSGYEGIAKTLLLDGRHIDINVTDTTGNTPLLLAVEHEFEDVTKLILLRHGVSVNAKNSLGNTALMDAAKRGSEGIVKQLLKVADIDVNPRECVNQTALFVATSSGHRGVVELLLSSGKADINAVDDFGETALLHAAGHGYQEIVELLLASERVDKTVKDVIGRNCLLLAALYGHESTAKLLIETGGIDVNEKNDSGVTALSYAAQNGHESIVRILTANERVKVNEKDNDGMTALSHAKMKGYATIVESLQKCALESGQGTELRSDVQFH